MRAALFSFFLAVSFVSAAHAETYGGVSIANDGWTKGYWNYSDLDQLKSVLKSECEKGSSLPNSCEYTWVRDNAWAAGVYCENASGVRLGVSTHGTTAKQAISAVYQKALKNNGTSYAKSDCKLKNLVAGNGSNRAFKK